MRYLICVLFLGFACTLFAQEEEPVNDEKRDSFLTELDKAKGVDKVGQYIATSSYLIDRDLKESFKLAQEGLALAESLEYSNGIMRLKNVVGNYYQRVSQLDSALLIYNQALEIAEEMDTDEGRAIVYNNIGIVYNSKGDFVQALEWYFKGLAAEEATGSETGMAQAYNNIAVVYYQQRDIDKTIEYLTMAVELLEKNSDEFTLKKAYNNIGALHAYQDQHEKALEFYTKSFEISERLGDKREIAINLSNMAGAYIELDRYEDAKACFERTMQIKKEENNIVGIAHEYHNYAQLYEAVEDFEKAEENFKMAIKWGFKAKSRRIRMMTQLSLSKVYRATGEHEKALEALSKHVLMKDSVLNEEKAAAIAEMETKYETEKKEKTILQQENEIATSELKIAARNRWILALTFGVLAVVLLGLFIVQRNKRLAQAQQDALVIAEREAGIKAIFEATENERKRIASDLHDGVGQQLSGLKLAFSKLGHEVIVTAPEQEQRIDQLAQVIDDACVDVRSISHEMMPKSLGEFGLVSAIEGMLQKSLHLSGIGCEFEPMVDGRFDEQVEISLYRICQELVNNIVKHSQANAVSVQLYKAGQQLIMMVEDNGKGITEQQSKDGIGLKNMKNRVSSLQGQISFEPGPENGTVVTVRIPLKG